MIPSILVFIAGGILAIPVSVWYGESFVLFHWEFWTSFGAAALAYIAGRLRQAKRNQNR